MQEWALVGVWGCVGESSAWSDPGREACVDRGAASFTPLYPQSIPWKWLFGATAVALGGVALSVVIAARN